MKQIPRIKSMMTVFPHSIDIEAPIEQARIFMLQHSIRHLPVTENNKLAGLLTDRDIKLYLGPDMDYPEVSETKVRDVYQDKPYLVDLDEPLDEVLMMMAEKHIGSALITKGGKLVGVFTSMDACRGFAEFLREE